MSRDGTIDRGIIASVRPREKAGTNRLLAALATIGIVVGASQVEASYNDLRELTPIRGKIMSQIDPENDSRSPKTNSLMEEFQIANGRIAEIYMKIVLMWDEKTLKELQTNYSCRIEDVNQFKELKEDISNDMTSAFQAAERAQNLLEGKERSDLAVEMRSRINHARELLVQLAEINMKMAATEANVLQCEKEEKI